MIVRFFRINPGLHQGFHSPVDIRCIIINYPGIIERLGLVDILAMVLVIIYGYTDERIVVDVDPVFIQSLSV